MQSSLRPKVVSDVCPRRESVFAGRRDPLNLSYRPVVRIPATGIVKFLFILLVGAFLIRGSVSAPTYAPLAVASATVQSDEERQALETQLKDLEGQIDEYENQIVGYQKQGSSLKNEIGKLNSNIAKLNLQLRATALKLSQLDKEIGETQSKIRVTEDAIGSNKEAIHALLHDLYRSEQTSMIEVFLEKPRLSDFFNDLNGIALVRNNIQAALIEVKDLHTELLDQKTQLSLVRADEATVKAYQDRQREETEQTKEQKNNLLAVTKGQESKYQTLLKKTKETAAQIRSRIFQLLGGGELSFEQAYQYAKLAQSATGVRGALLLAVLDRESALGRNVGKCNYATAMSPKERPLFLEITAILNLNPDSMVVSCPNGDGVYGGAMGPAQFLPSTWNIYKEQIQNITGRSAVSPWNNADAFVATALYLKDAGAADGSVSDERRAAAKYYAGSRWRSYLWTYGEAVISRATRFQEDINTISG